MNRTVEQVRISDIICRPQVREYFDEAALLTLAMTIKTVGVHHPVTVQRHANGYRLLAGERRWRAAKLAGLTTIPALVTEEELSESDIIEIQLIENCTRENLNPVEKAKAYGRLLKTTNRSAAQIAQRLGTSAGTVSKVTSLLLLASDILEHVQAGRIPYSSAYELAKVSDTDEQRRLTKEILDGKLTRDQLVAETKIVKSGRRSPQSRQPRQVKRERVLIRLGEGRSVSLSAPTITAEDIVSWLTELAERIRNAGADGRPLADIVAEVSRKPI